MTESLLTAKLFIPPIRSKHVHRLRLIEKMNAGLQRKVSLISAPAGFGKTTLVIEWLDQLRMGSKTEKQIESRFAWLSLDKNDNDRARFLSYLIAAINQIEGLDAPFGEGALSVLQSPQPPPTETILTSLINELAGITGRIILVLDDYHVIDAQPVDNALAFLIDHLPTQMHLVIATREDPHLPLARLRAQGQLTELRSTDLRFTSNEAAEFLTKGMGLSLSAEDITALETRTEGWIAGLQLAAISLQGHQDTTGLIASFSGSHRFVLDYLMEEVLTQQSASILSFLLQTAILDRLTGSLCDALTGLDNGQQTLEYLEQANLFIIPLDNERRWYRYHHLFGDLLRQRRHQSTTSSLGDEGEGVDELHIRASVWYEKQGLEIEAFQHAASANDVGRAERLIEGKGVPLQYRGASALVLNWLAARPTEVLDARPSLWVTYASALNFAGQPTDAEQKLQAAEAALRGSETDDKTNDLVGHIAAIRAMMAVGQNQVETIIAQSRRALAYLHPDNLPVRTITTWTLGYAFQLQGDRAAARKAYTEVLSISRASGNIISTLAATTGLGNIQESENQLLLAAESYRRGLQLFGDDPQPIACETVLGLARILYEWNDLEAAGQHGQLSFRLARQVENIDTFAICGVFLARLQLAQGDVAAAIDLLGQAEKFMRRHNFVDRLPVLVAAQVDLLLHQGDLAAASELADKHELPICQARVLLARGETSAALEVLERLRRHVEAKGLEDERLRVMVLEAVALFAHGKEGQAVELVGVVLALAEPGDFVRTFVDEGPTMQALLEKARVESGRLKEYVRKLLAAFPTPGLHSSSSPPLIDPMSKRELEVLRLLATELSGPEIAQELTVELSTLRSHTKNIYSKLNVNNRRAAVFKAEDLNLI